MRCQQEVPAVSLRVKIPCSPMKSGSGNSSSAPRWRFAKTYVESFPHEYTLDEWIEEGQLLRAIQCIERWGIVEPFFSARRKYFYVDERVYWHMGDASSTEVEERPGLINRSWTEVSRYREEARKLGYDDRGVDDLILRWNALLVKAKQSSQ